MHNRTAKFLSAAGAAVTASLVVAAVSQANAADCLASPNGASPTGSHWYYRTDHAHNRKCWYLRKLGAASAAAPADTTAASADDPEAAPAPAATKTASAGPASQTPVAASPNRPTRSAAAPLQPSVANARAEYVAPAEPAPLRDTTTAAPSAFPAPPPVMTAAPAAAPDQAATSNPAPADQGSTLDQRWSDSAAANSPVAADATKKLRKAAQSTKNAAPAAASETMTTGSAATLIGALLAALALAGAIVWALVRFSKPEPLMVSPQKPARDLWGAAPDRQPALDVVPNDITKARDLDMHIAEVGVADVPSMQEHEPVPPVAEPPAWIKAARDRHTASPVTRDQTPPSDYQSAEEIEQLLALAQKRSAA